MVEDEMHELWIKRAIDGEYLSTEAATHGKETAWAIDGLLTRTGSSVWFGPGATGKTQLLLQAALAIAAHGRGGPSHWLDSEIRRAGHLLVLTAEDTRDEIWMRLGRIARGMFPDDIDAARDVCGRIHVLPFLSMTEEEFNHEAPGIFSREGAQGWRPHRRMLGLRKFIEAWNKDRKEADRICGVLMDSATSMSGFDTHDGEAVTNLMFYLNRLCERSEIFWALIGHSQKEVRMDPERPSADAAGRLRGSGMWSTAPRMTVEVRLACDEEAKSGYRETAELQAACPGAHARDLVVVDVAKANVNTRRQRPRYLHRREDGILEDISEAVAVIRKNNRPASVSGQPVPANDDADTSHIEEKRLRAVTRLIAVATGGKANARLLRRDLIQSLGEQRANIDGLAKIDSTMNIDKPMKGSLGWYCRELLGRGHIRRKGKSLFVVDLTWADESATLASPSMHQQPALIAAEFLQSAAQG